MKRCKNRVIHAALTAAALATVGYTHPAQATTYYLYDANSQPTAPDPTSAEGGSWQSVVGGTLTQITATAGSHPQDGNYWQVADPVTNGSKGYGIVSPAPPVSVYQDPSGWTATEVVKVPFTAATKTNSGVYAPPCLFDIRNPAFGIADFAQLNSGADEGFFRTRSGGSTDVPLQDMDVHSYFNTYQMVYTPQVLDSDGNLIAFDSLKFYCNGFLLREDDNTSSTLNTTTNNRIEWFSGAQATMQTIQYQKVSLQTGNAVLVPPTPRTWTSGDGSFSAAGNWSDSTIPAGPNSTAIFGDQGGPTSITIDQPTSVGLIQLDSSGAYTIGGDQTLTLVFSRRGAGAVDVVQGNHTIWAPLAFERSAMFTILDPAASLSLTGPVDTLNKDFRKAGPGSLDVANVRANALKVSGGTLTIRASGVAAGVSKVSSLDISVNYTATGGSNTPNIPIATMDLNNNPLIIDYTDTSPTTNLRNDLKGAYDGGAWDGKGLTSSTVKAVAADANNPHKLALAYGEASALGIAGVGDQSLDQTSLLVRSTFSGDANMDGTVNALDFNAIASNFGAAGRVWTQGDFNYDGTVDTSDFTAMGLNFGQTLALSPAPLLGSVVPEPAGALLAVLSLGLSQRRRFR